MPRKSQNKSSNEEVSQSVKDARARLRARMGGNTRTGGKGSVRRKHKVRAKTSSSDDKRLNSLLKRLNVNNIPAIEEVNLFKDDGNVIHFRNPKVQASIQSNTYVVSGANETKSLQDLLPGIINQLGPDNLKHMQQIAESAQAASAGNAGDDDDSDDDDVPDLVENFDEVAGESAP